MLSEAERDDEDEKGRPKCRWRDNNRFWAILLLGPLSFGVVGCEKRRILLATCVVTLSLRPNPFIQDQSSAVGSVERLHHSTSNSRRSNVVVVVVVVNSRRSAPSDSYLGKQEALQKKILIEQLYMESDGKR